MLPLSSTLPEYTVTELSFALKKRVETEFARVRVRGEISGLKRHTSGHVYFALKDQDAVLDAVCWRGSFQNLDLRLQEGMEVIAVGRLTTYPGRSKYQIVVEGMELAGEGALLKLLEERKRKLAAEGLFDEARKKPLPFLPQLIGIVTSPTGAVIQDMLHRLADRFPVSVQMWPVAVQGEGAAAQISCAIRGFNSLSLKPDVLIVARGGGSLEDLWAFNEEVVVRAVAESQIPIISAVGHETDVTLIDFVADKRAPTPTAAAEFAVPVRSQMAQNLLQYSVQLSARLDHFLSLSESRLEALRRGLPPLETWLIETMQKLDELFERLINGERRLIQLQNMNLDHLSQRLSPALFNFKHKVEQRFEVLAQLLESYSYTRILERGFSFITHLDQTLIPSKAQLQPAQKIQIHFHDGMAKAEILEI
ncbi:MAG: exodeoxyribonuclease VII large subunit [Alphaproteobacteria bacterium]|jgi:exodeoxyribonuclease VII large subunit|nr:exodeoxyribonuclease VII large subunit [Alphaproteobacteria bacterium]MBP9777437.1 exodeoxyribonuclease VII large subunit [Alphaproteobacteria bacterium]